MLCASLRACSPSSPRASCAIGAEQIGAEQVDRSSQRDAAAVLALQRSAQRRLPAAGFPDHGGDLAGPDIDVDVDQKVMLTGAGAQAPRAEDRCAHAVVPSFRRMSA
ncbi:hypothetical protein BJ970_006492 [Saccharopolyspora phatthalungensis]|uniref:Uncharacterized protein n=1 Tax=Saccharopolyspora phatthalungensis TaxID=664693 RepID=A0A840QKG7_9PSEU|nr:hypothetical protein [Saccharopolyspora phatthalungensis]MBB5158893.1 hypothetical protein [Saccharopolyspora phatthalungensis]